MFQLSNGLTFLPFRKSPVRAQVPLCGCTFELEKRQLSLNNTRGSPVINLPTTETQTFQQKIIETHQLTFTAVGIAVCWDFAVPPHPSKPKNRAEPFVPGSAAGKKAHVLATWIQMASKAYDKPIQHLHQP